MAIYYVDATGGNDDNTGLSAALAWKTIAKVNASTFNPGDSILFKRGEMWRETLVAPSSGTAAAPITFGCYGSSGPAPVLNGAEVVGEWIQDPTTWYTQISPTPSKEMGTGVRNYRMAFPPGALRINGTKIRITVQAASTGAGSIGRCTVGEMAVTHVFDSPPTVITWNGGSVTAYVAAGAELVSDEIDFGIDKSKRYGIHLYYTNRRFKVFAPGYGYGAGSITVDQSADLSPDPMTWFPESSLYGIKKIEVYNDIAHAWYRVYASDPLLCFEDGALLPPYGTSLVDLIASPGGSMYADGKLYISATDLGDPNSNGKVYEVPARYHNIEDNGKSHLVFERLDCSRTGGTSAQGSLGGIKLTGSNNLCRRLKSHDHYRHALTYYMGGHGLLVDDCELYDCASTTVVAHFGTGTCNNILRNSRVWQGAKVRYPGGSLIVAHGASSGFVIERNRLVSRSPSYQPSIRIYDANTKDIVIRYNIFSGPRDNTIKCGAAGESITGLEVSGNKFFVGPETLGSCIFLDKAIGSKILNNSFWGVVEYAPAAEYALELTGGSTGTVFKNNVVFASAYVRVDAGSKMTFDSDYNCFYGAAVAQPWHWDGVDYATLGDWRTSSGADAHSLDTDPKYVGAAGRNLQLRATSPCRQAGVDVGLIEDIDGNPIPKRAGNPPDMGAHERLGVSIYVRGIVQDIKIHNCSQTITIEQEG